MFKSINSGIWALSSALMTAAALAGAGDGVQLGTFNLSPYISASYTHDSNPALDASDERDDAMLEFHGGVHIESSEEQFSIQGDFWGTDRRYDDLDEFDNTDFGDMIELIMQSKGGTRIALNQEFYRVEDIDRVSSSIEKVEVNRVGATVSKDITEKTQLTGMYRYTDKNYNDTDRYSFISHEFDLHADYDLTDKTALYASGTFSSLDGEENTSTGDALEGIVGFIIKLTDKLDAWAGVGIMDLSSDDSDEQDFTYEAQIHYAVTDKIDINLNGYREIEPSSISEANYVTISKAEVEIIYTLLTSLRLTLAATYREFDLNNPFLLGDDLVQKTEDLYSWVARLDYQTPADALELFLIGEINDQDSTVDTIDYDQYSITAGISIQY